MWLRHWLWIPIAFYAFWLVLAYEFHFLDYVNLVFHEAGHVFFSPFGPTVMTLGGTIGQFVFPVVCGLHFVREGNRLGVAFCGLWFAESGMYMAHYLGDAQAMALPLVGGEGHDWNWMLGRLGLVEYCDVIAAGVHALASVLALGMVLRIAWLVAESPVARSYVSEGRLGGTSGIDLGNDLAVLERQDGAFRDRLPVGFVK